ncbi:MAG: hypothetical protein WAN23_09280 [Candidatus Acidiferrales bacterium]
MATVVTQPGAFAHVLIVRTLKAESEKQTSSQTAKVKIEAETRLGHNPKYQHGLAAKAAMADRAP